MAVPYASERVLRSTLGQLNNDRSHMSQYGHCLLSPEASVPSYRVTFGV